jgi:Flp pilus assembly protein TadB
MRIVLELVEKITFLALFFGVMIVVDACWHPWLDPQAQEYTRTYGLAMIIMLVGITLASRKLIELYDETAPRTPGRAAVYHAFMFLCLVVGFVFTAIFWPEWRSFLVGPVAIATCFCIFYYSCAHRRAREARNSVQHAEAPQ